MASDLQEKANFTRLSRLLVDKGTEVLRNTFNGIHPPARLPAVLNANKKSLLRLKFKVINTSQWDLLYPSSGDPPDSKTFDVTLLTVLFRNICGFTPPSTGWDVIPVDTDRSVPANIIRLKYFRNNVYAHVTSTEVDNATFESLWKKISQSLVELGIPQNDIDDLKTCPLGPEEEIYVEMLKECKTREEQDMKDLQCSMQEDHNEMKQQNNEIKQQQNELKQQNNEIKQQNDEIKQQFSQSASQQQDNFEALQSSIACLSQISKNTNLEKRYSKERDENLLQKLAKHNFKGKIRTKVEFYHPGTREWLLKLVDEMVEKEQKWRMLLLTAGPGFGKSVFAAKVCEEFKKKGKLAACHFCDFSNSNLRDPMMMIQSLASQMCENIVGFQDKILDQLRRPHKIRSLRDAFRVYLQNPLDELDFKEPSLVVIDGLDESEANEKNEIINLLAEYFPDLPECMKVLVTSRPEIPVAKLDSTSIQKINIDNKDTNNEHDLERYLKACLPSQLDTILQNSANNQYFNVFKDHGVFKVLAVKCEGSFLYAFYIQSELLKRDDLDKITCDEIIKFLPEGVSSVYQKYFKRLEEELTAAMDKNINVLRILEMLAASEGILPLDFLTQAFGLAPDCRETKNVINRVNETVSCLLYVSDDMVTVFHKSVIDWLLAEGYKDHEYAVKASDGNKLLWPICEKVFEEIKDKAFSDNFNLTIKMRYALFYGPGHLASCKMKEKFFWLVDIMIIYVLLTAHKEYIANFVRPIFNTWVAILEDVVDFKLRARISWHVTEIDYVDRLRKWPRKKCLPICYLQSVLAHSPEGYFSEKEKEIAHLLLSKDHQFVEHFAGQADVMPHAVWRFALTEIGDDHIISAIQSSPFQIKAVGLSFDKTIAAVAQRNGTITVVSVPRLVKLWDFSTHYEEISCCTFAPDDSFALFGKLETVLNIAERKEVPFFHGNKETFTYCAFSPSGSRLVTSDCSKTMKLWDVAKQSLLSTLCADQDVNWCSFSNTGLFIIGDWIQDLYEKPQSPKRKDSTNEDIEWDWNDNYRVIYMNDEIFHQLSCVFCIWNAITLQRSDKRNVTDIKLNCKQCRRCFKRGFKELTYSCKPDTAPGYQERLCSTGVYKGVECIVELSGEHLYVKEPSHFTTLAAWDFFVHVLDPYDYCSFRKITAIEDDLWFYADVEKLIVFRTKAPTQEQPSPTRVFSSSFSPDGSRLATCTSDGYINIWNVDTSKVEQRFKCNHYDLSFACWWSDNFLFVFCSFDRIPSLTKYPVGATSKILQSESQQVSLSHLLEEFVTFTTILDFSNGLLSFECLETDPAKIVDITGVGGPQMITLPGIESRMSVTVSPGASFVFGAHEYAYYLWKRNIRKEHVVYEVYFFDEMYELLETGYSDCNDFYSYSDYDCVEEPANSFLEHTLFCRFSSDSKVAVVLHGHCCIEESKIFDLDTGDHESVKFQPFSGDNLVYHNKDRVVITAESHFLNFFDIVSGVLIHSSFQQHWTTDVVVNMEQIKLSPKETVLAFPQMTNNVEFRRLCIPQSSLLSKIKCEAAERHEINLKRRFFCGFGGFH